VSRSPVAGRRSPVAGRPSPVAGRRSSTVRHWSLATAFFAAVAALLFVRQLAPDRVLLPVDVLFLFPPYAAAAAQVGVVYPENTLVADTVLQNVGWKQHARGQWLRGQSPLWNPAILTGQPFLAAGQNASLYPPGALFFVLPLADAYEWFAVLHFTLAGVFMAMLLASLGVGWLGRLIGGLTFELCGFLVVSVVWPMMVSTAVWLPLLLCVIERVVIARGDRRTIARWAGLGIMAVALQFLAGHLEISFYILATCGAYAALRLAPLLARQLLPTIGVGSVLLGMVAAGTLLAAIQIVPFVEAIGQNVRVGQVSFAEVQSYAFDRGQWWTFVLPDFFGNPTHRTYLDARDGGIHSVDHTRTTRDGDSELRRDTEWGKRNYVEGASYLGVTAVILGLIGAGTRPRAGWPFVVIAVSCLFFAFGSPLYALVFYGLPGGNQVHTPFRWVYPWTICLAVLAGLGANALTGSIDSRRASRVVAGIAAAAIALGTLAGVSAVGLWQAARTRASPLDAFAVRWSEIRDDFPDVGAFASYLAPQVLGLAALLILSGVLVWLARRRPERLTVGFLGALLAVDLWTFGVGFNPAGQRALVDYEPPALEFLRAQPGPFRIAALGPEDVLPANLAMRAGVEDIRGYDTIIRRDYVAYLDLIERPGALLYSKVEKLFDERSLGSPLFHALNVGYVLSARPITQAGYELVQSEGVYVYRNARGLPRAFMVSEARFAGSLDEALEVLRRINPASIVVLESGAPQPTSGPGSLDDARVEITSYSAQEVSIKTEASASGYLVVMDAFDTGWIAQIDGQDAPVLRANRAFRAVSVPSGEHDIRMLYRPLSFRVGLLLSAIGGLVLGGLTLVAFWPRRRGLTAETSVLGSVIRNISAPFAANLISRVLDLGLALVMFRFLGPSGVGAYTFAVVLTGYLDILAGFGLATLVIRDAARHPERLATYFGNSLLARAGFWAIAAAFGALVVGPLGSALEVSPELSLAVALLILGLLPSSYSATLSALLQARERFDVPASVTIVSAVLKVMLGLGALLAGWGFVGLAAVSIVTNLATASLLTILATRSIRLPRPRLDVTLTRVMIVAAYPLMLSQVLNALFFRIDALLLKPLAGDEALGWYSTAYRFIDAFQIIPSTVILALFPLISRQADDRAAVVRSSALTLRALLSLAFPIAIGCTLLAEPIILAFAGSGFVPQSVIALQILIWYLPLSFVNGLAQYVLIARGRQKILTLAFALGVIFNLIANLVLIPRFGYQAAAWITVASEMVLLIPFWIVLRSEKVTPDLWQVAWRSMTAALVMGAVMWPLTQVNGILTGLAGAVVYVVALMALRGVTLDELRTLRRAL
jgi:O-antigen/teichoic acid export membrane protein